MKLPPCKGCTERKPPACHAHCSAYISWKEECDEIKARMRESKKPALESARRMDYLWKRSKRSKIQV